jgi:hypothetical protein
LIPRDNNLFIENQTHYKANKKIFEEEIKQEGRDNHHQKQGENVNDDLKHSHSDSKKKNHNHGHDNGDKNDNGDGHTHNDSHEQEGHDGNV